MGVTPVRSRREFQVGPSQAIHSDPRALDPLGQLADVDLILPGRVSLLRILLSVISVPSVVIRSSYLPESSPRLSAPARTCGRGRLARFSLPQRLAVWWVALPWPILPVPAVLLALCRIVVIEPCPQVRLTVPGIRGRIRSCGTISQELTDAVAFPRNGSLPGEPGLVSGPSR